MDIKFNIEKIKSYLSNLLFEKEYPNIYERIARIIFIPLFIIPAFIIGLIFLKVILPLVYFFGGFIIDVILYIITGKFIIIEYYDEHINDYYNYE